MATNFSLKQLKVFTTLVCCKTLTQASEALFLSKAAVSMTISELEKQIGHALFDRINNRLVLNQEGQKLLPLADEILLRAEQIGSLFTGSQTLAGQLRIGASDTIGNQIAPELLSGFRRAYQHKSQSLMISNTAQICQKLIAYELDIGLIEGATQHKELLVSPFSQDEMCVICPPAHSLANQTLHDWHPLENNDWVLREAGSGSREFFLKTLTQHLDQWQETLQLNTTEALINSVSSGLGLGCLSKLAARHALTDGRVAAVNLPVEMKRTFSLVVHKEKYQSALLKCFIEFCQQSSQSNLG